MSTYIDVFHWDVWMSVAAYILVFAFVFKQVLSFGPNDVTDDHLKDKAIFIHISSILQQGE